MQNRVNQCSTTDEALVDIPMPFKTVAEAIAAGFKKEDIRYQLIGNRKLPCIMVKGTEEERFNYIRLIDNERKAEDRERRCLIPDDKGGFIMCPECNKCGQCKKKGSLDFDRNRPLSLDKLREGDGEEDRTYDPASKTDVEGDAIIQATLEMLLERLHSLSPEYASIFELLYNQFTVKEVAKELDIPWSTAKDRINKVRKLAQDFYGKNSK